MVRQKTRRSFLLLLALCLALTSAGCGGEEPAVDYANDANWVYREDTVSGKAADVFFINPTVYSGDAESPNMDLADQEARDSFLGAVNMERGIYDDDCRFFAPYYRQAGLYAYTLSPEEGGACFETAYSDVRAAFLYYMEHYNEGRPIVLAGFSQGADMCLRLMKDCFADDETRGLLVACYAIGWRLTQEDVDAYPHLRPATGAGDVGVIVSFNSEAESVSDSLMIPAGTETLSINPLNWRTDATVATAEENLGACFTDYSGAIQAELPQLTGAYLAPGRGALKVPDVSPADYPPVLHLFADGVYHLYDYQFFYRNLEENVGHRIEAYLAR